MKRWPLIIVILFLFSVSVNATGLALRAEVVDNLIMIGEEAIFDVTVTNEQSSSDRIRS